MERRIWFLIVAGCLFPFSSADNPAHDGIEDALNIPQNEGLEDAVPDIQREAKRSVSTSQELNLLPNLVHDPHGESTIGESQLVQSAPGDESTPTGQAQGTDGAAIQSTNHTHDPVGDETKGEPEHGEPEQVESSHGESQQVQSAPGDESTPTGQAQGTDGGAAILSTNHTHGPVGDETKGEPEHGEPEHGEPEQVESSHGESQHVQSAPGPESAPAEQVQGTDGGATIPPVLKKESFRHCIVGITKDGSFKWCLLEKKKESCHQNSYDTLKHLFKGEFCNEQMLEQATPFPDVENASPPPENAGPTTENAGPTTENAGPTTENAGPPDQAHDEVATASNPIENNHFMKFLKTFESVVSNAMGEALDVVQTLQSFSTKMAGVLNEFNSMRQKMTAQLLKNGDDQVPNSRGGSVLPLPPAPNGDNQAPNSRGGSVLPLPPAPKEPVVEEPIVAQKASLSHEIPESPWVLAPKEPTPRNNSQPTEPSMDSIDHKDAEDKDTVVDQLGTVAEREQKLVQEVHSKRAEVAEDGIE